METVLSPTLFPRIWDEIIAGAEQSTRNTLRGVDTMLRATIDRLQVRHLVLTPEGLHSLSVTGPQGKIAAFADQPQCWKDQRLQDLLSYTRVVDVRGFCPPTIDLPSLATAFRNLDVVRISPDASGASTPYVPWPARTLVLFAHFEGFWVNSRHWWWDMEKTKLDPEWEAQNLTSLHSQRPIVPRGVDQHALFGTYERVVLNFNGDLGTVEEILPLFQNLPKSVKDVILVLPRNTSLGDTGTVYSCYTDTSLHSLTRAPHAKYTFVGFDIVKAGYDEELGTTLRRLRALTPYIDVDYELPCPDTHNLSKLQRYIGATRHARETGVLQGEPVEVPAQLVDLSTKMDQLMANVEFITQAKYRKRVDEEVARLETLEFFRKEEYVLP